MNANIEPSWPPCTQPSIVFTMILDADHGRYKAHIMRTRWASRAWSDRGLPAACVFVTDADAITDAQVRDGFLPPNVIEEVTIDDMEIMLGRRGAALTMNEQDALRAAYIEASAVD